MAGHEKPSRASSHPNTQRAAGHRSSKSLRVQLCGVAIGDMSWTNHIECFWGRMATLEEWITYIRRVMETDDDFEADVVCAACRQLEVPGKEGG